MSGARRGWQGGLTREHALNIAAWSWALLSFGLLVVATLIVIVALRGPPPGWGEAMESPCGQAPRGRDQLAMRARSDTPDLPAPEKREEITWLENSLRN